MNAPRRDRIPLRQRKADWWTGAKRWSRLWYLRLMRQNSSPRNLAAAMALGMFIGAMPIMPFQSVVVVALAFAFRVNKLAAWLATCYSNAATMVPFYYFLFKVGRAVTGVEGVTFDASKLEMEQLISAGWDLFLVMFAGGLAVGIPATVATYFLSLFIIRRYRQRRAIRLLRKKTLG
ncbi:DUF2062 domain-containing protein [Pseudodesulfovibrio sp. F-1]|uniref:DUF2062 domain-containing protein n=1 Tax=Pseudodesulfovibrio alkaliphilus TaxID=2661613 RepID=A0A7K1KQG2_9BACT|nr:DUF2062 domain-containing protein [Pseudodesulfovibrio alkaliphilus]MUM78329.1 DUF2062 domain-containing protein [Pseudodesulfovibrio alkaliphilus]